MKLRTLIAVSLATAIALIPAAADAKGVDSVRVSGPGLTQPIQLDAQGANNLAQAAGLVRRVLRHRSSHSR